ncbi:AI-2E family transporter [Aetokthonos hydrillicola Thurmond2011]|jgi:predicted PurR-regulated permease PerM|uniref:AI-2E family transporter n=1 Tax=Aetokthonos hydrillicola Thurmond2011 TaxID=2712845 RepID=A0AAP5I4M2_9CYAN|nr:AI-2E family transporter [Aetokthonos hydrillicola]MBO3458984.1 AI-2E family transporter [Aetokthonos hydrillicola CCALA 1050]MBW4589092.1 AI-2E family transporter [Aetokthonos hydrillicola CCALA 1050]MDR9894952.1 AI-2E family transporter [Aetokthonos hydrillicola Thurmond2011]
MASSNDTNTGWSALSRGAPFAVIVAVSIYILYRLLPVIELTALAALIALILRTVLRWLEKIVKSPWLSILILIGFILGFVVLILAVVIPSLITETQNLLVTLPHYLDVLNRRIEELHRTNSLIPDISQGIVQLQRAADALLKEVPLLLRETLGLPLEFVATLILSLYMAYDPKSLINGILRLVPRRNHQKFKHFLSSLEVRLKGWIFGTGVAMIFLGLGATLGLWALGIPSALAFGIIAGLLEVIPYVGTIVGTVLPALVALSISPVKMLLVLGLFLILNQVDAHLVQPLVMGKQVNLHPVMVILTFLVMGKLLGFFGVLLAVPIAAVVVTIIDEITCEQPATEEVTTQ